MASIAHTLQTAAEKLAAVCDSPRLDAEILLGLVTGKTRTHFRAWPEKPLTDGEAVEFAKLLALRLAGQPIAHIVGRREFWSREFAVSPQVLIPRPETELLVELALERIQPGQAARIADLGTGSGAIAITLALELPAASVTALDQSPAALEVAKGNARDWQAGNVRFLLSDWFSALDPGERFELIVSNPPYIAESDPHLCLGDLRFEPRSALASGSDGLDAIRHIVKTAPAWLKPGAWLLLEHGYDQAEPVKDLLFAAGFTQIASFPDLQGHNRVSGGVWPESRLTTPNGVAGR